MPKAAAKKAAAKKAAPKKVAPKDSKAPSGDIAWTDKLRGKTFASRAMPNPLHLTGSMDDGPTWVPDEVPYPYNVDAAWKEELDRSWTLAEWARPPTSIPVGYANATPELAAIARAALDAFGKRSTRSTPRPRQR